MKTELVWVGADRFEGSVGGAELTLDGDSPKDLSPMQAVAAGLAGCMSIDVRMILERGRLPLEGLTARLEAERAAEPPRSFVSFKLHFVITGDVPPDKVERAIHLSKKTYCSVWHSLDPQTDFETTFEVHEGAVA